jgi:hypothetical protein
MIGSHPFLNLSNYLRYPKGSKKARRFQGEMPGHLEKDF